MAPSNYFHKPELALRRAIELQGINQSDAALELLHDVLSSRRHRTWSLVYEQIMMTYLDLCLDGQKSRECKDGLHQYRNLSQTQAPGSLEKIILYLLGKAEAACTEAKAFVDAEQLAEAASAGATAVDGDTGGAGGGDDDGADGFGASPQAILLSTMSTDPAKNQRDSTLLLPSLKFLWEIYRSVLDILRSNSKLEHVYHHAAMGALKFCRIYNRRMEFRHLCDMLRVHLGNLRQFGSIGTPDDEGGVKSNSKVRRHDYTTRGLTLFISRDDQGIRLPHTSVVPCFASHSTGPRMGGLDSRVDRLVSANPLCSIGNCQRAPSLHGRIPHGGGYIQHLAD
jgi:hypothetical protein